MDKDSVEAMPSKGQLSRFTVGFSSCLLGVYLSLISHSAFNAPERHYSLIHIAPKTYRIEELEKYFLKVKALINIWPKKVASKAIFETSWQGSQYPDLLLSLPDGKQLVKKGFDEEEHSPTCRLSVWNQTGFFFGDLWQGNGKARWCCRIGANYVHTLPKR